MPVPVPAMASVPHNDQRSPPLPSSLSLRRVERGDLTVLKTLHDVCFPISYPEEFYPKLLTPHWVAVVAVVPLDPSDAPAPDGFGFGFGGGLGLVGKAVGPSAALPSGPPQLETRTAKDRIVGFITGTGKVLCNSVIPTHVGYISTFGVDPTRRRGGVGRRLFDAFMQIMRYQYDFKTLRILEVWAGDAASINEASVLATSAARESCSELERLHPSPPAPSVANRPPLAAITDTITSHLFHTSPAALVAMAAVRVVARCEDAVWRWRGKRRGDAMPEHDVRIRPQSSSLASPRPQNSPQPASEVTQVWLHVLATNTTAINFYLRQNFKKVKYLEKFYFFNEADHDGIIMCYDLAAEAQLGHPIAWDSGEGEGYGRPTDGYRCSLFSMPELAPAYPEPARVVCRGEGVVRDTGLTPDTPHEPAAALGAEGGNSAATVRRVAPTSPLRAASSSGSEASHPQGINSQPSACLAPTEHSLLMANMLSTRANWLFQLFTSAPLGATFDSLDNIETSEQSNAVQWVVCTVCLVASTVMGAGAYALFVLSEAAGGQGGRGRRSMGTR